MGGRFGHRNWLWPFASCLVVLFASPLCPDKCHAFRFLFPCSGFECGAAYVANLCFRLFPLLTPVGLSFGVFRQKWHNWISAQILYIDSFGDVVHLTAAIGNLGVLAIVTRPAKFSLHFHLLPFFTEVVWIKWVEQDTIRCGQDKKGRKSMLKTSEAKLLPNFIWILWDLGISSYHSNTSNSSARAAVVSELREGFCSSCPPKVKFLSKFRKKMVQRFPITNLEE